MKYRLFGVFSLAILLLSACKNEEQDPCASDFNRRAMIENIANTIIWPAYQDMQTKLAALETARAAFAANVQTQEFEALQTAYYEAALAWQSLAIYNFGKADAIELRKTVNTFPVFVARLNDYANSGTYDLEAPAASNVRGFPALDYLLYGPSPTEAYNRFTGAEGQAYQNYMKDVVAQLQEKIGSVADDWSPQGGNYLNTFINNEGVATGSAVSLLINALNENYETIKNERLGDPIGAKVSYVPSPNLSESFYGGFSLDFIEASIQASKNLFLGGSSLGLYDYLQATAAEKEGRPLHQVSLESFDSNLAGLAALRNIGNTLPQAISADMNQLKAFYADIVNHIIYIKTDMPAVLCVSIVYFDNADDGD